MREVQFTFRPLDTNGWGQKETSRGSRYGRGHFTAPWSDTLRVLKRETAKLGARDAVIEIALSDAQIRKTDGLPRSGAAPTFPGVRLSFESKHGPLRYQTDQCTWWEHNVRCIALGLEALRTVDRYGITSDHQQYVGWLALEQGPPEVFGTSAEAIAWLKLMVSGAGETPSERLETLCRQVARLTHPDLGGSVLEWHRFEQARAVLRREKLL